MKRHVFLSLMSVLFFQQGLIADGIPEIGQIPDMQKKRLNFAALIDDQDRIYAVGGDVLDSGKWSEKSTIERFTPGDRQWESLGTFQVARRGFAASLGADGKIYIFAGKNIEGKRLSSVEVFDPQSGQSKVVSAKVSERWDFTAARVGNTVYLIGGDDSIPIPFTSPSPPYPLETLAQEFRGTGKTEYFLADSLRAGIYSSKLNLRRFGHASVAVHRLGKIFVFGGRFTGALPGESFLWADLKAPRAALLTEAFDVSASKWVPYKKPYSFESIPAGRIGVTATLGKEGSIYVAGGAAVKSRREDVSMSTVYRFFPETGKWSEIQSLPEPRAFSASVTTRSGKVVVLGGGGMAPFEHLGRYAFNSVFEYDPKTKIWR